MSTYYLRLEFVRLLRDVRYVALAVGSPIGFYLLCATLFGGGQPQPGHMVERTLVLVPSGSGRSG
jgi:ABC-2 type transport system permease protein